MYWRAQPKAEYHAMQQAPALATLAARVAEMESLIAEDPHDERVRKRQFRTEEGWVWLLEVQAGRERWMLGWGFDAEGNPEIRLLTPARAGF